MLMQVRAAADVLEAEQQQANGAALANAHNGVPDFNFKQYMGQRAELMNQALDASVPMQYPELVNESMRCIFVGVSALCSCASFLFDGPQWETPRLYNARFGVLHKGTPAHMPCHHLCS